jgi:glycosyltransferase involved in cell wall biosynthesis
MPSFPSISRAALVAHGLLKKKLIVKVDDDYAWKWAIGRGKTYLLASDFQQSKKTGRAAALHQRQIRLCGAAEAVIVPSEFMAGVVNDWGIAREKIRIVSGGADFKRVEITKEEARKQIGIPGNVIVSAGPLVAWKGFRMLVKIMPQLVSINQFFRLVIVGKGPELKLLQAMIKNTNLDKKVRLVQQRSKDELVLYLVAADMFILNSGHEPFPGHVIEAMSAGVPVITTAVGANLEIIKQGENGFMVKHNDEFNLIEAVKTIWQTPELCRRFIEEGKKTAVHFSSEKMISETIKILGL